ncbi:MAG: hypothetical protein AUG02_02630 [Chloroflexi bacterium 13_1_20CM_2_70_9]|nr:MAG: hypothetical protein AUG02_02630 [Chloroflexi bacterium 13_1_20CM_2_70_9]
MITTRSLAPRRRPLWVVAALTVLSLGIYLPIWLGLSWVELRRETKDETMQPLGHALSLFVPGYGYYQVYRHFALIDRLLAKVGAPRRVDALSATIGVVLWSFTWLHYSSEPLFILLDALQLAAATAVVAYGQRALNDYWLARPGDAVAERLLETDWFAMVTN